MPEVQNPTTIQQLLVQLRNENVTNNFENLKKILEFFRNTSDPKYIEIIEQEYNFLSKEIDRENKKMKEV